MGLDSLVDVVTNTNGMLILLAVFTTVMAVGKTYQVSYPIVRSTEKAPVFFECRDNRVLLMAHHNGTVGDHYRQIFTSGGLAMVLEDGEWGETGRAIQQPNSAFQQAISGLDPGLEYPAFIVRPDSFEVFRTAREVLWEHRAELDIGWEPFPQDGLVVFGSRGRSVAPQ